MVTISIVYLIMTMILAGYVKMVMIMTGYSTSVGHDNDRRFHNIARIPDGGHAVSRPSDGDPIAAVLLMNRGGDGIPVIPTEKGKGNR